MVQIMKFLIVKSPIPILNALGAQIFASGSCFQIPLAYVPPLLRRQTKIVRSYRLTWRSSPLEFSTDLFVSVCALSRNVFMVL
jgi:hypothetical protein